MTIKIRLMIAVKRGLEESEIRLAAERIIALFAVEAVQTGNELQEIGRAHV